MDTRASNWPPPEHVHHPPRHENNVIKRTRSSTAAPMNVAMTRRGQGDEREAQGFTRRELGCASDTRFERAKAFVGEQFFDLQLGDS